MDSYETLAHEADILYEQRAREHRADPNWLGILRRVPGSAHYRAAPRGCPADILPYEQLERLIGAMNLVDE